MFPCKVKIEQLDKTNKKVKDVDIKANKALTKSKIKKVAAQEGERTPFYYLGNYFEENGKAVGDFLALGKSLKLEKHFVKNEMKNSAKSLMSKNRQDPKKACTGEIYVENSIIHFVPNEKSKIPVAKWAKIFKEMKGYFSGMKAVVVINGEVVETVEGEQEMPTATGDVMSSLDPIVAKEKVQELLKQFKALEPGKAFKGLALINKITSIIDQLDNVPENLQLLSQKLSVQQERIVPVFSKQIDHKLEQSMTELEEIPEVESSDVLDNIFGTVKKMYKGWTSFLPEREHPKGAVIEKVDTEIGVLKEYEKKIVPLRDQYDLMEDSEEKELLRNQINELINEAKKALG